jgi:hypothetical protein
MKFFLDSADLVVVGVGVRPATDFLEGVELHPAPDRLRNGPVDFLELLNNDDGGGESPGRDAAVTV